MTTNSQDGAMRTAFLVLDYATYIVENFSHDGAVAQRAAVALAGARQAGLPVIYVVPDGMQDQIHPLVAPAAGEPVLGKKSLSAFATANLDEMLRQAWRGAPHHRWSGHVWVRAVHHPVGGRHRVPGHCLRRRLRRPGPGCPRRTSGRHKRLPRELARAVAHRPGVARGADQRVGWLTARTMTWYGPSLVTARSAARTARQIIRQVQ